MTWRLAREPQTLFGLGGLPSWLVAREVHTVSLWTDPRATASARVETLLRRRGLDVDRVPRGPGEPSLAWLDAALARSAPDAVVAVGGGSVIDRAKLHAACLAEPSTRRRLGQVERCGWTPLPPSGPRAVPLLAVPTTLGTGSEVSRFACYAAPDGKRLVQGDALQPDLAVVDAAATSGLDADQVTAGVVEVLARVIGPYIGTTGDVPVQDRVCEAVVRRLVELGDAASTHGRTDDALRLEVARLSARSHDQWLTEGREPFASRTWFLATELAGAAGCGKAEAVAALLPAMWEACSTSPVWGDARRVDRLWSAVRDGVPGLPSEPGAGVRALLDRWGFRRALPATEPAEEVSRRTHRRWGAGLPMLAGVQPEETTALLRGCLDPDGPPEDVPAATAAGGTPVLTPVGQV
nr:daptide-type RiPP biosynthesis dehydogenase [uncultured Actinotalea sp.]